MSYAINIITNTNGTIVSVPVTNNVLNGYSIVEKLDDSLDIGSIVVRGLTKSTPYTMFDTLEILDGTTVIHSMRIAGDSVSLISKSPLLYTHTLSLIEHTKILELFIVGAKTFTQPTDGTTRYYLFDVINTLRLTTPIETSTDILSTRLFVMPSSGDLYDILTATEAPELTFNNLTLREALKQACDYIDGIPRLIRKTNGDLEFSVDFVGELKDLISSSDDMINKTTNQDITLYATNLETQSLNLVNDALPSESVEIYPADGGYVTYRKDTFFQGDFENSFLPTPKNIYNLQKVVASLDIFVNDAITPTTVYYNGVTQIDVISRIVEKSEYDTLVFDGSDASVKYKTTTWYYTYKDKNVFIGQTYGQWGITTTVYNVLEVSIYEQLIAEGTIPASKDISELNITYNDSLEDFQYNVHYVPIPNSTRLSFDRADLTDVDKQSTMSSNQQSRIINLENFSNNLYGKINRIGNSDLNLENRVLSHSSTNNYSIGDYTDEMYITTVKESIYFKDYVHVKYELSRNFNKISSFIGVNSEIRQWEIGERNTLLRNLIYKEYIEIDAVASGSGSENSKFFETDGRETFLDTFKGSSLLEPVRGAMIVGTDIPDTGLVPLSSNGGGNSLIFSWVFPDNKTIGFTKETINGQVAKRFIPYADDDGISQDFSLYFFDKLGATTHANALTRANLVPESDLTYISKTLMKNLDTLEMYKDNREIIGGTIQFQMIPKDINKIILGRYFSLRNRLVSENPPTSFKIYRYSGTFKFNQSNNFDAPSGYISVGSVVPTIDVTNNKISFVGASASDSAYCITDENDKILIAVNQDGTLLNTITFDFNNKRSGINYKY